MITFEAVREVVSLVAGVSLSMVTEEATLCGDLSMDSLDCQELQYRLENEFDATISDEHMQALIVGGNARKIVQYLNGDRKFVDRNAVAV